MVNDLGFTFSRRLNNSNYELWKSCMECYLVGNDLWKATRGERIVTKFIAGENCWNCSGKKDGDIKERCLLF